MLAASASVAGKGGAFVEAHGDVGAEQVLDLRSTRSGVRRWRLPSRCDAEGDAVLVHLPQRGSDITW